MIFGLNVRAAAPEIGPPAVDCSFDSAGAPGRHREGDQEFTARRDQLPCRSLRKLPDDAL